MQTPGPPAGVTQTPPSAAPRPAEERLQTNARINVIARSRWDNGIPPVMGAHLMASGTTHNDGMLHVCQGSAMSVLAFDVTLQAKQHLSLQAKEPI